MRRPVIAANAPELGQCQERAAAHDALRWITDVEQSAVDRRHVADVDERSHPAWSAQCLRRRSERCWTTPRRAPRLLGRPDHPGRIGDEPGHRCPAAGGRPSRQQPSSPRTAAFPDVGFRREPTATGWSEGAGARHVDDPREACICGCAEHVPCSHLVYRRRLDPSSAVHRHGSSSSGGPPRIPAGPAPPRWRHSRRRRRPREGRCRRPRRRGEAFSPSATNSRTSWPPS